VTYVNPSNDEKRRLKPAATMSYNLKSLNLGANNAVQQNRSRRSVFYKIMNSRKLLLQKELEKDIEILKNKYDPDKIILFGSLGSGKIKEWSDIDLIIIKDTEISFYERIKEILLLLKPTVGMDIFVYTPEEFSEMKERLFIKEEVLQKGRVVYEKL